MLLSTMLCCMLGPWWAGVHVSVHVCVCARVFLYRFAGRALGALRPLGQTCDHHQAHGWTGGTLALCLLKHCIAQTHCLSLGAWGLGGVARSPRVVCQVSAVTNHPLSVCLPRVCSPRPDGTIPWGPQQREVPPPQPLATLPFPCLSLSTSWWPRRRAWRRR